MTKKRNKSRLRAVMESMTHTNTFLNGRDLLAVIVSDERARHQRLIEQGRAPGQSTTKSINKARVVKHPGKGNRNAQNRAAIREF